MLYDVLARDKDIVFRWEDTQGYMADSSLRKENPLMFVSGSKGDSDFEKDAKETPYSDPRLFWKGYSEEEAEEKTAENEQKKKEIPTVVETKEPKATFKEKEVEKYISGTSKIPTFAEWKEWPGNKDKKFSDYEVFKKEVKDEY